MQTKERRRDKQGRYIKTCLHLNGNTGNADCNVRAGYYVDGWGQFGLAGTTGTARYCLKHGRQALRSYKGSGHGYQRNTYRLLNADHKEVK